MELVRQYGRTNFFSRFFSVLVSNVESVRRYDHTVMILFHKMNWCDNTVEAFWDTILIPPSCFCCFCLKRENGATIWSYQFHISLFCRLSLKGVIGVLFLFHKMNWCDNMVAQF